MEQGFFLHLPRHQRTFRQQNAVESGVAENRGTLKSDGKGQTKRTNSETGRTLNHLSDVLRTPLKCQ